MGAFLSAFFAIYLKGLPMFIHLPLTLMAAFFGGGLWGFLSGWMKTKFNASEIITTIMLNYVAIYWVNYMVTGPMMAPTGNIPQSEQIPISAKLQIILPGTRVHFGLILAILCIIIYYIYFWKTTIGYETKVVGRNIKIATYSGMEARKIIPLSMFMAGGMAGLAGGCVILGIQGRLLQNFSPGYGYDGIAIGWLSNGSPLGILFASIFFGFLRKSGNILQMFLRVPVTIVYIIAGISIIFVIFVQQLDKYKHKN
jgi:simple sugar transport system permease protein